MLKRKGIELGLGYGLAGSWIKEVGFVVKNKNKNKKKEKGRSWKVVERGRKSGAADCGDFG